MELIKKIQYMKQKNRNMRKIKEFYMLEKGWDGNQANTVSPNILDILKGIIVKAPLQPEIYLTEQGYTQLEFERKKRVLEIEVRDKEVLVRECSTESYGYEPIKELSVPEKITLKFIQQMMDILNCWIEKNKGKDTKQCL